MASGAAVRPVLLPAHALRRMAAGLLLAALAILWLGRGSDLDLALADAVFDSGARAFPWRHAWLAETLGHVVLKWLLATLALGFIALAAIDACRPWAGLDAVDRLRLRVVALSAVLVPVVTSGLKQFSASHCPWDLARYGGAQPYVRLFDVLPPGALPGHCLPAGHASSALWVLSLAVAWLPARPHAAGRAAIGAIAFGLLVGYLQQLRGAHFMTHTLWSVWIACAIVLSLVGVLQARR